MAKDVDAASPLKSLDKIKVKKPRFYWFVDLPLCGVNPKILACIHLVLIAIVLFIYPDLSFFPYEKYIEMELKSRAESRNQFNSIQHLFGYGDGIRMRTENIYSVMKEYVSAIKNLVKIVSESCILLLMLAIVGIVIRRTSLITPVIKLLVVSIYPILRILPVIEFVKDDVHAYLEKKWGKPLPEPLHSWMVPLCVVSYILYAIYVIRLLFRVIYEINEDEKRGPPPLF